ncbi:methyl-accepting chemotaxis protein [Defluviitalea saccharophila]|uniref:Methyl-accepting chemotaxis protein n=1 Tax=Defluviitalea saccharophila TaxID=879970 RepID=A0ABZ2Y2F8_9FIRM|nr:methyl-accepting chemotaxis protein [Candidatus Epulonipiscium sp.]
MLIRKKGLQKAVKQKTAHRPKLRTMIKKNSILKKSLLTKINKTKLSYHIIALLLSIGIIPCLIIMGITKSSITGCVEDIVSLYSQKIVNQLSANINESLSLVDNVISEVTLDRDFKQYTRNYDTLDRGKLLNLKVDIDALLLNIFNKNKVINGLYTINNDRLIYSAGGSSQAAEYFNSEEFLNSDVYKELKENISYEPQWVFLGNDDSRKIYIARRLDDTIKNNDLFMFFSINENYFNTLIKNASIDPEIPILILDKNSEIALCDNTQLVNKNLETHYLKYIEDIRNNPSPSNSFADGNHLISYSKYSNGWLLIINSDITILMRDFNNSFFNIFILLGVFLIIIIFISIYFAQLLSKPISKMSQYMEEVGRGNLNVVDQFEKKVTISNQEMATLVNGFTNMVSSLRQLLKNSHEVTDIVEENASVLQKVASSTSQSAREVALAVESLAKGAEEQSMQTQGSVLLLNDLSNDINNVHSAIYKIRDISQATMKMSQDTKESLDILSDNTNSTINSANNIYTYVKSLGDEASNISNILNLVKSVNDQTNLLALNAAIEAARAGKYGKGFAVVADEVRNLSYQTQNAINTIAETVKAIHEKKEFAMQEVEKSMTKFNSQIPIVNQTNETFNQIFVKMENINEEIQNTTTLLNEVMSNKENLYRAISEISQIIEQSASIAEEVSAETLMQTQHSDKIAEMANDLLKSIEELKQTYSKFR